MPYLGSSIGLISHLKCCLKRILEKNVQNFSLRGLLFVCCRLNVYRSALIFRNLPCPEKFLVTRLRRPPNSKQIKQNKWKDRGSKVWLKVENAMHKNRWSHGCYRKVVSSMQKDSSQDFLDSLETSSWCDLILLKLNISLMKIWKTFPSHPKYFLNNWQAAKFF